MEEKYLSEVIDFDRDIKPFHVIRIYSGVGSGKNYWVETLAKRENTNILLITSRAATAEAQASKLGGKRWIDFETLCQEGFGKTKQKKVIVTNSGIEKFIKYKFDPENDDTHIWDFFNIIVLDEAHSMATDATFSEGPFYVKAFLDWAERYNENCKIIYMTGTPEPTEWLFPKGKEDFNYLNYYNKCKHVDPEYVMLYSRQGIEDDIVMEICEKERKIIYFANSIARIESLVPVLIERGVSEESIGISYSNAEKDHRSFSAELIERFRQIQKCLLAEERLPDNIKIFITTSKNQEGININNEDFKIMISEAQDRSSLVQMAGRVRKGLEQLIVLYDAQLHSEKQDQIDIEINTACVSAVNDALENYVSKNGYGMDSYKRFIEHVEGKFYSIRYDYLEQCFSLYEGRIRGYKLIAKDREFFQKCISNWYSTLHTPNQNDFYWWFPFSARGFLEKGVTKEKFVSEVKAIIEKGKYLNEVITTEERDCLAEQIRALIKDTGCTSDFNADFKLLGPILKKLGFELKEAKNCRKGDYYQISIKSNDE